MDSVEPAKKRKKDDSRRIAVIDFDKLERKFLTVLKREANRLMDLSFRGKLSEEASKDLINYMNILKKLKEDELKALEALTDEELEQRAKINQGE